MSDFAVTVLFEPPLVADAALVTLVNEAATTALRQAEAPAPGAVNVLLADDAYLQRLNRDFRGYDKPTDVLSFAADFPLVEDGYQHLGDIAISLPQAERQAAAGDHATAAELQLLTVHGVLHLLGYDHGDEAEKAAMWSAQAQILTALGAAITAPVLTDDDD